MMNKMTFDEFIRKAIPPLIVAFVLWMSYTTFDNAVSIRLLSERTEVLSGSTQELSKRTGELSIRTDSLSERVEALSERTELQFKAVNARLDTITDLLNKIDGMTIARDSGEIPSSS